MAPSKVEEAPQTNAPPNDKSGLLTPSQIVEPQWTPETVLSTLTPRPQPSTTSPLPFMHLLTRLKTTKREGWRRFGIDHGESISDHMYRMSIITMLCPPSLSQRLDIGKCVQMALVHDMAEALVGDITPVDGVDKGEKSRREAGTMDFFTKDLLWRVDGGGAQGERIRALWQEYEDAGTEESVFVHDVDKIELLLQMMEYEREKAGTLDLGEFTRVAGKIQTADVRQWAREVLAERKVFWEGVGRTPTGSLELEGEGAGERNGSGGNDGVSEERKRQQDDYYTHSNGAAPGAKAVKLNDEGAKTAS
ncbi:hypothetical protein LTR86_008385 [Recurvomyces mirabilis]|nr:hypothetical protein LTR86_008385 [Recurvomyces mirabilis]